MKSQTKKYENLKQEQKWKVGLYHFFGPNREKTW